MSTYVFLYTGWNITLNGTTNRSDTNESLAASIGVFIAILVGSLACIFILIGGCIIWHQFYMKCLKKKM